MCLYIRLSNIYLISTPNIGFELMTLRSRVTCSTNWSSQAPVFVIFDSLPLSYCLSMFQGAYLLLLIIFSVSSTKHSVNICWMFFISIFRKGANRRTKRSQNFPSHLKGNYREVQLLLREELMKRGFGSGRWNSDLVFSGLQSCHKLGNQFGFVIPF